MILHIAAQFIAFYLRIYATGPKTAQCRHFIKMYNTYNPPHIHAIYNDDVAAIDYMTGEVLEGYLPPKALAMVREWLALHKNTLQEIWETQEFKKIPPLE